MHPTFTHLKVILLTTIIVAFGACGVEGTSLLISDSQEAEIGAEVHQQVLAEYPLMNDTTAQNWVNDLGSRLETASLSERDGVNYQFFVLDTEIVNAFAAPGGYVYLTRGLINMADNEAQMAGVLAHEIGHIAHRHSVAQIERAFAIGLLGDLVFGDGSIASDVVDYASAFVLGTQYSQAQETDADTMGVQFTIGANISPFGLSEFFETLAELSGDSMLPDWLSSHPQPLDRAAAVEALIDDLVPGLTKDDNGYAWDVTGNFSTVQSNLAY